MLDENCKNSILAYYIPPCTVWVCFPELLCVPGQILQESLQLITYQFDQPAFNVAVGHVNHKDVGRRVRRLVVLCEKKAAGETNEQLISIVAGHEA